MEKRKVAKRKTSFKVLKKPENFTLVFAVLYIMLIIMSLIGRVSTLKYTSTTEVTFGTVLGEFTMPFIVVALLIVTTVVYYKNKVYGATLEIAVGLSMVMDILVSVFSSGFDILALLLTLVLPCILIIHSIITLMNIKKENKKPA
jgi:Na+/H+ antiporter NhaC